MMNEIMGVITVWIVGIAIALAIGCLSGCGFMGVKRMELWKGGPNWDNAINQEWSISTQELAGMAVKRAAGR